jgi:hypothetical protein
MNLASFRTGMITLRTTPDVAKPSAAVTCRASDRTSVHLDEPLRLGVETQARRGALYAGRGVCSSSFRIPKHAPQDRRKRGALVQRHRLRRTIRGTDLWHTAYPMGNHRAHNTTASSTTFGMLSLRPGFKTTSGANFGFGASV